MSRHWRFVSAAVAILSLSGVCALAQNAIGPFTQAQVTAGRADYLANCAECHGANLDGVPLTGQGFNTAWANSTPTKLFQFISSSMPEDFPGDLPKQTYLDIASFILAVNGAKPGPTPFMGDNSNVRIGDIANGQTVMAVLKGTP